ncbi:hypothetical protein [Chitinophaga filiformis]|uniref:Uncharacterized protein n=1 Tax=Chitinophaga filiformis TaxID=104663 RepID=A0A1G7GQL3_CHIFI|nr:hypothetical protein [Chitinophaga filiformis]SDE90371.1 hypothetical protein SAMN04488121_101119 [Chitinophaga filiformis]
MKKYLPLFFIAGMMAACNDQETSNSTSDTSHIEEAPSIGKVPADTDTFSVGSRFFTIYPLEHSSFPVVVSTPHTDSLESNLQQDSTHVKRLGDTLIFTLNNGEIRTLVNNKKDDPDVYCDYVYAGYIPEIHHYLVFGSYYESDDRVLVNADNGDTTHIWGRPIISPDHKHVICPSLDLIAGFYNNGFQLFSYRDNKLILEGDVQFDKWGPGQTKWLDNNTIETEYVVMDSEKEIPKTVKLIMK